MVSGPIHLVTNAEFYNHKALAKQYALNDGLQSRTDTEVILKLIERHGVATLTPDRKLPFPDKVMRDLFRTPDGWGAVGEG